MKRVESEMVITIRFLGSLRHSSGKETITLAFEDGASVLDVVTAVSSQKPELRRNLIDEQLETLRTDALILINGREISALNGLNSRVRNGDEIIFIPVVHGG